MWEFSVSFYHLIAGNSDSIKIVVLYDKWEGVLIIWEVWQNNIAKCEETKILALSVKVKKKNGALKKANFGK